jgi:predicted exporter
MPPKRLALGLWLAFLAVALLIACRASYRTDMGDFLPSSGSLAQQVLAEQVNGGAPSHILLAGISGAPAPVLAALSAELAAKLHGQAIFTDVLNGADSSFAGSQEFIWRNRYLLSPDTVPARFAVPGLHAALESDLGLLAADSGTALQQSLPADPNGAAWGLARELLPAQGPRVLDGVWMSGDGSTALLLIHTAAPGFALDAQQRALDVLTAAFARARTQVAGASVAQLEVSGPGVFAVRTRDATKSDVTRLSALAMAGAVTLLLLAYRSPRVLLLGLLPVASGAIAAIAAVALQFGFVHGITLGFGITLIGESMDYAIYLFTQRAAGETPQAAIGRIWPVLRLGALTSAAGFTAMLFSSFRGFAQLGLFSIAGLAAAALVTRFILPALMPRDFTARGAMFLATPVDWLVRHRQRARYFVAGSMVAAIMALGSHHGAFWDPNLLDLSPIPSAAQALDQRLRLELGVPDQNYFAVITAASAEQALTRSEALAPALDALVAAQKLGAYDAPSAILPSLASQRARQAALPDAATLRANLAAAASGLPFRPGVFEPFVADVQAARTAPALTARDLPPPLALRLQSTLLRTPGGWVAMVPLYGVADPDAVAQGISRFAGFVNLARESGALLYRFEREAVGLAAFGSLAVFALLLAGLRSLVRAARVMAPLLGAMLVTVALLTAGGASLTIFKVAGFLLIVAVGSNYCLFFERATPGADSWRRAAASILLANLCTVAAYGLLSLSAIPVLHDIGLTVALGTFLSLVFGAVMSTGRAR